MLVIYINDNNGLFVASRTLYGVEEKEPQAIADYLEREFVEKPVRILVIVDDMVKYDYAAGKDFEE